MGEKFCINLKATGKVKVSVYYNGKLCLELSDTIYFAITQVNIVHLPKPTFTLS